MEPALRSNAALAALLTEGLATRTGRELKTYENSLDAVFCAYVAYYFWYWGWERSEVFGELSSGYILNPSLVPGGIGNLPNRRVEPARRPSRCC